MSTRKPRSRPIAPSRIRAAHTTEADVTPNQDDGEHTLPVDEGRAEPVEEDVESLLEAPSEEPLDVDPESAALEYAERVARKMNELKKNLKRTFTLPHRVLADLNFLQAESYHRTRIKPELSELVRDALALYLATVAEGDGLPLGDRFRK